MPPVTLYKSAVLRLYPNNVQIEEMKQQSDHYRWMYNKLLWTRDLVWRAGKVKTNKYWSYKFIKFLRSRYQWLEETPTHTLRGAADDLDNAYKHFFKNTAKYPKFKKAKQPKKSFSFCNPGKFKDAHINIPGIGQVRCNWHIDTPYEDITKITIHSNGTGKWYASVGYSYVKVRHAKAKNKVAAYDLNIGNITMASGKAYQTPRALKKQLRRLKLLQRGLKRKTPGSRGYKERLRRIAGVHAQVTGTRNLFQNQFVHNICRDNQAICLDGLSVRNMVKNRCLSRSISDEGWGNLEVKIRNKAKELGRDIIEFPRFFSSSQLCGCGYQHKALTLADRQWTCPGCGKHNDRDINAAENKIRLISSESWQRRWGAPRTVVEGVDCGLVAFATNSSNPVETTREVIPAIKVA